jgi:hypothetical protein
MRKFPRKWKKLFMDAVLKDIRIHPLHWELCYLVRDREEVAHMTAKTRNRPVTLFLREQEGIRIHIGFIRSVLIIDYEKIYYYGLRIRTKMWTTIRRWKKQTALKEKEKEMSNLMKKIETIIEKGEK